MLAAALTLALPRAPFAHEIPATVLVQAFIRPQGHRLHLLARVPLAAMRDVAFPLRGGSGEYLDIPRADSVLRDAARLWIAQYVKVFEGDSLLPSPEIVVARVSLPSDRSFANYDDARRHLDAPPLDAATDLPWRQAMLDVLLDYPIHSDRSRFAIEPSLAHLGMRTTTVLRFVPPSGTERVLQYAGNPGLVRLEPSWRQAAQRFVSLGFAHILSGIDHLLFLFCLVIPVRRLRPLVAVVTSFTVAHSITLIAAAAGLAPSASWFPPLIEALIALSILYMALENIVGARLEKRWLVAFGFGLVHGFGFSFFLRESLQFAGSHLAASLLAFNVGVELGQLLVIAVAIPALGLLFTRVVAERMGTIVLSALVAHTAWHWMLDRGAVLMRYRFEWPALDAAFAASAIRVVMLLLVLAAALWALFGLVGRLTPVAGESGPAVARDGDSGRRI